MTGTGGVTRRAGLRTTLAAALAVPLLGTVRASQAHVDEAEPPNQSARPAQPVPPLRAMTFNLRFASTQEPNSWAARRPVTRELLLRAAPSVVGTQEGVHGQILDIAADLGPRYAWIGTGLEGRTTDESLAIYYDTARLQPLAHGTYALSDTPEDLASNTWGAAFVRMCTWVRFRDRLGPGREFYVLNTHLDHRSQYARARAASLIADRMSALTHPALLLGDFNVAAHDNEVYDTLLRADLVDTWDSALTRGPSFGTFHNYRGLVADGWRIDWVLATPGVRARRAWVDTYTRGGQYPSDHLPVCASVDLT
ncbi:endonuclease/exonuclease/phosphatase family protein [Streptomyces acidiscabies]|uniref:endonuclease/exonuclease/phosphatase family protein n=1 Tax=Streptomyces acidiscabies TaxID=42234 RepID=UPI00073E3B65|nr:endonuclease/exonuclease/phosphatase family protein [Streptomyces acidiscabies]GAQ58820.1 endonuclease/exonuclease/phosphatase family protein [Streptomyces acidiscabies]